MESTDTFEEYKVDGNEAVSFNLIRSEADVKQNDGEFQPAMCHQVFGDSEKIFGYKGLTVKFLYSAASLKLHLQIDYTDKIKNEENVQADDIMKLLLDKCLTTMPIDTLSKFISEVAADAKFKPFGNLVHSYTREENSNTQTFEIYHCDVMTPGFLEFHERLQTFIIFFIDGASFIDTDDDKWQFFVVYEKYLDPCKKPHYATVGYLSAYQYYCYPNGIRPRLSQFLILPPFQKQGHGQELLQTFNKDCQARESVKDVTVEDPSEEFQRLRDFVDCQTLMTVPEVRQMKSTVLQSPIQLSKELVKEIGNKFCINKRQTRRCYEILLLRLLDGSDKEAVKNYRLFIKQRLNKAFLDAERGGLPDKLPPLNNKTPAEFFAEVKAENKAKKWEQLEAIYKETVELYRLVINRLQNI